MRRGPTSNRDELFTYLLATPVVVAKGGSEDGGQVNYFQWVYFNNVYATLCHKCYKVDMLNMTVKFGAYRLGCVKRGQFFSGAPWSNYLFRVWVRNYWDGIEFPLKEPPMHLSVKLEVWLSFLKSAVAALATLDRCWMTLLQKLISIVWLWSSQECVNVVMALMSSINTSSHVQSIMLLLLLISSYDLKRKIYLCQSIME